MDGMRRGIVVLDFGSQYNQLIARRVRELGVYSVLVSAHTPIADIVAMRPAGIIFSGGPASVYDDDAPRVDPGVYALGVPILGICYGMQMIAADLGGRVEAAKSSEYGAAIVQFAPHSPLTTDGPQSQSVWMSHSDHIVTPPDGFVVDGRTDGAIAAMSDRARGVYAVQFHPEVEHTKYGLDMLRAFVLDVCGCAQQWTAHTLIDDAVAHIKQTVGDRRVLCALSGGVDSSVVAALLHRAIGNQLTCMFIDHGFLRQGEAEAVMETFSDAMDMHVVAIDARAQFLEAIADVDDPEMKRKRIGHTFIETFEREAKRLGTFSFLAQGTLYTDVVESGTATAQTIKSHHNVGGLPERMQFALIEPLRELFKDEVRRVG
ncbi:MAG: glutamine-hydrolyzing GMP synthase, partial [Paenibacillaceae bacterium]|nr:glutamine-hydrolyzing GMP synthase [Paenibacillaceae bacterium]